MNLSPRVNRLIQKARRYEALLNFALRKLKESVQIFGLLRTAVRLFEFLRAGKLGALVTSRRGSLLSSVADENKDTLSSFYPREKSRSALSFMTKRVLIVAERSIPQCTKYRVEQKAELLNILGIENKILDWTNLDEVRNSLQVYPIVIFYRVPAVPEVILLIEESKRLGVHTIWEVDDLVFDPEGYRSNKNLATLDFTTRHGLLAGMKLYRDALLLCDEGLASTAVLARLMTETTGRPAHVVQNTLDAETLRIARRVRNARKDAKSQTEVTIVYGSGTKTHDIDFLSASEAIYHVLSLRPNVKLRIIGELNIESKFEKFSTRIERVPLTNFEGYLEKVASADISIAPLEQSIFNDAKSNIKFLEASVLGLPSICSPAEAFKSVITNGETGIIASDTREWEQALLNLVDDKRLRARIADRASEYVSYAYTSEHIAQKELAPLMAKFDRPTSKITRILLVNVYFAPQSYGGATIVAEEMAQRLAAREHVEIYVFTTWANIGAPDYGLVRYDAKGATVLAVKNPVIRSRLMDVLDYTMGTIFREVLRAIAPDIVQLHSIQTLGVELAAVCKELEIPYTVTLHDAWWLCERQFMVTGEDQFCNQTWIDPTICASCVQDKNFNRDRTELVHAALVQADGIIAPSEYFKTLHMRNGLTEVEIIVNKNGVRAPSPAYKRKPSHRIRFGYVGGSSPIKGYDLVRKAFSDLQANDLELVMVDNTLNQGYSSVSARGMHASNPVRIVPAYSQDTIDNFFSEIDVLLFPSQWKESFGLTVREALIRDIWVIVSDAGGAVEDVVPGENGDIIPISNDSHYLKSAMENVIQNRKSLETYINPHKNIIQSFDRQAEELFIYLEKVIALHAK